MLRCVSVTRVPKIPQEPFSFSHRSAGKLHQTGSLSFLPIVSSLDTAKKEFPPNSTADKARIIHTPDDRYVANPEAPDPHDNTIAQTPHDTDGEKFHGESPAQPNFFSASLADGTIVHSAYASRHTTLSRFKRLASKTSKFWKQHSHSVRSQISAQTFGIAVSEIWNDHSTVTARIYDIDARKGPRTVYRCKWNVSNTSIVESKCLPGEWNKLCNVLPRALENHVGSVDQHDSLVILSPAAPHSLFHAFKEVSRIFAYDRGIKSHPISVVLDENILVSPIPGSITESDTFLSLAKIVWQWLQRERGLRVEALSGIIHIRIIETDLRSRFLRVEVWAMSHIADKSLVRSVYKLFFLAVDGPFATSRIESRDHVRDLRKGADHSLRDYALRSLKHNIGWIDSAGRLIEGKYPNIQSLVDEFKKSRYPPPSESQPLLSPKTAPTLPESQEMVECAGPKLAKDIRGARVATPNSDGKKLANKGGTGTVIPENDSGSSVSNKLKDQSIIMSASLHDGTLVVPSYMRCLRMRRGQGLGFRDILKIIFQWRARTREEFDHEQWSVPLLFYIRFDMDPCFVVIDVFRRGDDSIEQSMTRWKLHHTPQTPNCSFIKAEPTNIALQHGRLSKQMLERLKYDMPKLFRPALQNHVGIVDETGLLRMSNQPTIHEAYYEMEKPFRFPSTALSVENVDTDHAEARYTPLEPADNEKAERGPEPKPEQSLGKTHKDDHNRYLAYEKGHSIIVSATLQDGSLVVPSYKLCEQMSTGVGKSFSDILRIISQWRTQTCRNSNHGQEMIYVFAFPNVTSFAILTLGSDIQTLRSNLLALPSHSRLLQQPMTRIKLYHKPGTTESSYVDYRCVRNNQSNSIEKMQKLLDTFESGLKNHVGVVDETGSLRESEQSTAHEVLSEPERPPEPGVRYTPPEPAHNGKPEKKPENELDKLLEDVQGISMHDQIASTMKLAGALFEVSTMLNEELSNAPSQKDDNTSFSESDLDLINEPNPVFRTMKNGEVDIDAVQKAMADFRTRLGDRQDESQILAYVCRRWKDELEARYPMMKRKSVTHNDVGDLLSPRSKLATQKSHATREPPSSKQKEQGSPTKVRFMIGNSELKLASTTADSKEDKQPNKQQEKFDNDRGGTQPYNYSSDGSNHRRGKNDDGFSISSW